MFKSTLKAAAFVAMFGLTACGGGEEGGEGAATDTTTATVAEPAPATPMMTDSMAMPMDSAAMGTMDTTAAGAMADTTAR